MPAVTKLEIFYKSIKSVYEQIQLKNNNNIYKANQCCVYMYRVILFCFQSTFIFYFFNIIHIK